MGPWYSGYTKCLSYKSLQIRPPALVFRIQRNKMLACEGKRLYVLTLQVSTYSRLPLQRSVYVGIWYSQKRVKWPDEWRFCIFHLFMTHHVSSYVVSQTPQRFSCSYGVTAITEKHYLIPSAPPPSSTLLRHCGNAGSVLSHGQSGSSRTVLSEALDWCIFFTKKIQHGGDWERSRPQGSKNVHNFLTNLNDAKMLLMLKNTIFDLLYRGEVLDITVQWMSHDFVRGHSVAETCFSHCG